jgi:adenylate cyclase
MGDAMTPQEFEQKLTAILSADVAGYSPLIGEDEGGTICSITVYRELIASLTDKHHGKVVDSPRDNVLSEFAGVVEAVSLLIFGRRRAGIRLSDFGQKVKSLNQKRR